MGDFIIVDELVAGHAEHGQKHDQEDDAEYSFHGLGPSQGKFIILYHVRIKK